MRSIAYLSGIPQRQHDRGLHMTKVMEAVMLDAAGFAQAHKGLVDGPAAHVDDVSVPAGLLPDQRQDTREECESGDRRNRSWCL